MVGDVGEGRLEEAVRDQPWINFQILGPRLNDAKVAFGPPQGNQHVIVEQQLFRLLYRLAEIGILAIHGRDLVGDLVQRIVLVAGHETRGVDAARLELRYPQSLIGRTSRDALAIDVDRLLVWAEGGGLWLEIDVGDTQV